MSTSLSKTLADARALWSLCFDDDEQFIDFYFSHVATEQETLVHYSCDGSPIAHIGLPVYHLRIGEGIDQRVVCTYISGACVHPEHRRGGLMRQLMTRVLQDAATTPWDRWDARMAAVILIPASEELRQYYTKHFDFVTIGRRHYSAQVPDYAFLSPLPKQASGILSTDHRRTPQHLLARGRTLGDYGLYHSQTQWEALQHEYSLSASSTIEYVCDKEGECQGLALARLGDDAIYVDYIVALAGTDALERLINALRLRWTGELPILFRHANQAEGQPWGMIRPVCLMDFLRRHIQTSGGDMPSFSYTDRLIPDLTGTYSLEGGEVIFRAGVHEAPQLSLEEICHLFIPPIDISLVHE